MRPGYQYQESEFDSEILRSANFQLISITLDTTARYDISGAGSSMSTTKLPKGLLLAHNSALADDSLFIDLSTAANRLAATATQFAEDVVVLAETILDVSAADQPVKAYLQGTFDFTKIKYTNSAVQALVAANVVKMSRLYFIDGPVA